MRMPRPRRLPHSFKVVAVEADPRLAQKVVLGLKEHVDRGDLTIVNAAISDQSGEIDFYANDEKDDWGTASERVSAAEHRARVDTPMHQGCPA
jgi:FkbM family methyltransferase